MDNLDGTQGLRTEDERKSQTGLTKDKRTKDGRRAKRMKARSRPSAQPLTKYISNVRYGAEFWQYLPKLVLHNGDTFAEGRQNIF